MASRQNVFCAKINNVNRVLWEMRVWGCGDGEKRDQFCLEMSLSLGWRTVNQSPAAVRINELLETCLCFSCCLVTLILAQEMATAGNNFFKN